MTIAQYCILQQKLSTMPFRVYPDGRKVHVDGEEELTSEQLRRKYPIPISFVSYRKKNADGTKNWMVN